MGGKSFKTEMDHRTVCEKYNASIKKYGAMAKNLAKSVFYKEVSDDTGYSDQTVRKIVSRYLKNQLSYFAF